MRFGRAPSSPRPPTATPCGRRTSRRARRWPPERPASEVTLADVFRAVDGPLVTVRDERPPSLEYEGSAAALLEVWVALRASVRDVLDRVTIDDVVRRDLPDDVHALAARADAWENP